jgi:hypothetical protein
VRGEGGNILTYSANGAQGAALQELADSYARSISTMRRATRAV